MTYFGSVYGQIELKERPPIITREQEKDIANKLTQGIRDYLTSEEAFEAQARFTAEKLWEGLFEWANQACPHQFYANTKQQCPACWDELRDSIYGKQARQEDKGGEMTKKNILIGGERGKQWQSPEEMTEKIGIDEAIELLRKTQTPKVAFPYTLMNEAIQLGIEALERLQCMRRSKVWEELLPSEESE